MVSWLKSIIKTVFFVISKKAGMVKNIASAVTVVPNVKVPSSHIVIELRKVTPYGDL